MKLTEEERAALLALYEPGQTLAQLDVLEQGMTSWGEESYEFSEEALTRRRIDRAVYRSDLITVEMMAFYKGVEETLKWLEEHRAAAH